MASTNKAQVPVIDLKGQSSGEVSAPAEIFAIEPNENAVHFACEAQRFHFYTKTASSKTRAAVSGGGKKSRKQKGTGGARQGGTRAPHWVGGGVVFGPKPILRDFKINKKVAKLALASILSDRLSGGQVRVIKGEMKTPKTQDVAKLLGNLNLGTARVGFVVSSEKDAALVKSVRNLRNVDLLTEEHWTTFDFIKTDSLIFSESAFQGLTGRLQKKAS